MKIGLTERFEGTTEQGVDFIQAVGRTAEELGFSSFWAPEHMVFFDNYAKSRYPFNAEGELEITANQGSCYSFLVLAAVALATTTLRIGTSVIILGERNPIITAKEVATLDQLSKGRLTLGVGIGWAKEEYEVLGVPWDRRADRTDEYVHAMRSLWTETHSTFDGEFVKFTDAVAYPKPWQSPHPPVLYAGAPTSALRRVARHADGWYGYNLTVEKLRETIDELRELLDDEGRDQDDFYLQVGLRYKGQPNEIVDYVGAVAELGVDELTLTTRTPPADLYNHLGRFADALQLVTPARQDSDPSR